MHAFNREKTKFMQEMIKYIQIMTISYFIVVVFNIALYAQSPNDLIYVGERVCRDCHHQQGNRNQYNPWRLSKHAQAYSGLLKPEAKEIAELSGIDIEPHTSPICLGCHTTAYNVDEWERDSFFNFEDGIQCEQCHGPGSGYSNLETMQDRERAFKKGLVIPEERDCMVCHIEKNSHIAVLNSGKFNFESAFQKIQHSGMGGSLTTNVNNGTETSDSLVYVGAAECKKCHSSSSVNPVYSKWHMSAHATAYANLSGDKSKQIALQMGVAESVQQSQVCLECHTTGSQKESAGFNPGFDTQIGVQCESCHGPGSKHINEADRTAAVSNKNLSLPDVNKKVCLKCHTPGIHGKTFEYQKMLQEVDHSRWEQQREKIVYKTPFNLAISKDGERLFIACEASNSLIVLNTQSENILAEIAIGSQPHFVCLSPDGKKAYVSNRASDNVSVIDTKSNLVHANISVGDEPHEMAITPDGKTLYVANAGTYDVSVVDLIAEKEIKRLAASRGPWGVSMSHDGNSVYVSNNLSRFGEFRTSSKSEITEINTKNSTIKYRHTVDDANLIQGIAVSPDNEFVLTTLIRTKNLIPMTRNIQGWIMTNGLAILWKDGRIDQLLLDEVNDFFADPTDIVFSKDGKYAFVSGGGVQQIAMIDLAAIKDLLQNSNDWQRKEVLPNHLGLSFDYVVKRIPVGQSPRGMVVSPDNRFLYVADGLDDAISVIDIAKMKRVNTIDLGRPKEITQARYGERIFHSAENTYARQFSCHSCHPDGGIDGLTYDIEPDGLGLNPVDNRTLRGINDTAPFKWTGKNRTLQRQCGPRLAAFFTRIDPFTSEQSAALDRYIVTIPRPPNRYRPGKELNPTQLRGKQIFERSTDNSGNKIPEIQRCNYCHSYPYFTNRQKFDVGTSSRLDTHGLFDVPHLNNIYATAPYLHDGRASSLEEIWTIYNPKDKHGLTNDLTKDQLNDLIEYLKTL
jgi:YVTN family beta-propeller protein